MEISLIILDVHIDIAGAVPNTGQMVFFVASPKLVVKLLDPQ